jgi:hypothetical protein
MQLNCHPAASSSQTACNLGSQSSLSCSFSLRHIVLPYFSVFLKLPLDSIWELKRKCEVVTKQSNVCKIVKLGEKVKILDKLQGHISAAVVGLTFH